MSDVDPRLHLPASSRSPTLGRSDLAHAEAEDLLPDTIGGGEEQTVRAPMAERQGSNGASADETVSAGYVRSNLLVLNGGVGVADGGERGIPETARRVDMTARGAPGTGGDGQGGLAAAGALPKRALRGRRAAGSQPASAREPLLQARGKGYEGEACGDCGNFTLVRNGTCMKCVTCGATSGCS